MTCDKYTFVIVLDVLDGCSYTVMQSATHRHKPIVRHVHGSQKHTHLRVRYDPLLMLEGKVTTAAEQQQTEKPRAPTTTRATATVTALALALALRMCIYHSHDIGWHTYVCDGDVSGQLIHRHRHTDIRTYGHTDIQTHAHW